eukprot:2283654-Rhodomonas_salina.1
MAELHKHDLPACLSRFSLRPPGKPQQPFADAGPSGFPDRSNLGGVAGLVLASAATLEECSEYDRRVVYGRVPVEEPAAQGKRRESAGPEPERRPRDPSRHGHSRNRHRRQSIAIDRGHLRVKDGPRVSSMV